MSSDSAPRRGFLQRLAGLAGLTAAAAPASNAQGQRREGEHRYLPRYARSQAYKSLKQSSHDLTGGNSDRWPIKPGDTQEVFRSDGPGVITHIWFTIAAQGRDHLKELVLRMYWEGSAKPSVETPIGDFFGLNLGQYSIYQSAFLNCSPIRALNCYFAMPFKKSALPDDVLYFHAQYRQAAPNPATEPGNRLNPDGKRNYVYAETRGRGHLMGVTLGMMQNAENWMGEGDDMIFVDDETKPIIIGTGSEDYFCGAWNFGGRDTAIPFAHLYNGAHLITTPEHGHANDRADNFYSVCYWYQTELFTDFPPLPPAAARVPVIKEIAHT